MIGPGQMNPFTRTRVQNHIGPTTGTRGWKKSPSVLEDLEELVQYNQMQCSPTSDGTQLDSLRMLKGNIWFACLLGPLSSLVLRTLAATT